MNRLSFLPAALVLLSAVCPGLDYVYGGDTADYYTMIESQARDSMFVMYLRGRGLKLESDANGLLRIYMNGEPETIAEVVKFLGHMKKRMEILTGNLANFDTTRVENGKANPYRRKDLFIDKDGNASVVIEESSPRKIYSPGHPDADERGYIYLPNINPLKEIVNMYTAQREYFLAESLLQKCLPDNYVPDYSFQRSLVSYDHFSEMDMYRDRLDRIERRMDALMSAR